MKTNDAILTINYGSSSLKIALFDMTVEPLKKILSFSVINDVLIVKNENNKVLDEQKNLPQSLAQTIKRILDWINKNNSSYSLRAVGHRIVHGGNRYLKTTLLHDVVVRDLENFIPLAPLHQGYNLMPVSIIKTLYPQLPQFACFDTSFHVTQSKEFKIFGLPRRYYDQGIYRYGFHGLSFAAVLEKLPVDLKNKRVIIAHLGSGASLAAIKDSQSVYTTTGFSALEGLLMGTRCGTIDPGVLIYLLEEKKMSLKDLKHLLYEESGLLGLSGISSDMKVLLESVSPDANEAIQVYVHRILQYIGSMMVFLKGLDVIVFTAGVGENAPQIRKKIIQGLSWYGVSLDDETNDKNQEMLISDKKSTVKIMIIKTDEEKTIAEEVLQSLALV